MICGFMLLTTLQFELNLRENAIEWRYSYYFFLFGRGEGGYIRSEIKFYSDTGGEP